MELSTKQSRFVEEYLIDGNATRSAIAAGYSTKTAYSMGPRLLKNVGVKKAIDERHSEKAKDLTFTRESLLQDLIEIVRDNKKEKPNIAIKAIEVINKMTGFDTPKEDITRSDNTFQIKIVGVNKEEEPPIK